MQQLNRRYWTVGKILALLGGVVVIAGVGAWSYQAYQHTAPLVTSILTHEVMMSGTAQTTKFGTAAFRVVFCPGDYGGGGGVYRSVYCEGSVTAAVTSGRYSAVLTNQQLYTIFIGYNVFFVQQYCDAGQLTLGTSSDTYPYDISC